MSQELVVTALSEIVTVAETDARLAALDMLAVQHVAEQRRTNTATAYDGDWRTWQRYTTALGIPETTATVGAFVGFVVWLEKRDAAPTTIDRRLAGVAVKLRERGIEPSKEVTKKAREALAGYERRLAEAGETRGRGKAPALTVPQLRAISRECPDTLAGTRDRALTLVAFSIAGRRSEVAHLDVADIARTEQGMTVHVRFGKSGARKVAVPNGNGNTCPVAAWEAWKDAAELTEGPAFRRIDRHGNLLAAGMSGQAVGAVLTRASERADVEGITGHSARAGMVTAARRAGHDVKTISEKSGHLPNSAVLFGYMREVDQWSDNAANGIGL